MSAYTEQPYGYGVRMVISLDRQCQQGVVPADRYSCNRVSHVLEKSEGTCRSVGWRGSSHSGAAIVSIDSVHRRLPPSGMGWSPKGETRFKWFLTPSCWRYSMRHRSYRFLSWHSDDFFMSSPAFLDGKGAALPSTCIVES